MRDFVLDEMTKLHGATKKERTRQERRLAKLRGERKKLLDAHYADAIPLDLVKTEQARIGHTAQGLKEKTMVGREGLEPHAIGGGVSPKMLRQLLDRLDVAWATFADGLAEELRDADD